ncbi:MAG: signal peptidase II [Amphiplicatus sp.]
MPDAETPGRMKFAVELANWRAAAAKNPLFRRGLAGAAAIALLDQAVKYWIVDILRLPQRGKIELSGIFDLTYVQNRGASFGMLAGGAGSRIFLSLLSLVVAGFLIAWLARLARPLAAAAVALIIGGAVGNLVDRARFGYVVDFLDFSGLYFPWVFNVADAAINVGVALLILDWLRERKRF